MVEIKSRVKRKRKVKKFEINILEIIKGEGEIEERERE